MPDYPTLEKINAIQTEYQICMDFLEWMQTKFAIFDPSQPRPTAGYIGAGDYLDKQQILNEYFEIDTQKAEEERMQLLHNIQKGNLP